MMSATGVSEARIQEVQFTCPYERSTIVYARSGLSFGSSLETFASLNAVGVRVRDWLTCALVWGVARAAR